MVMRNRQRQSTATAGRAAARRRFAFTLTELMVSVAILSGMMAMIAMVFTTATKASGKAQASTTIYRQLRQVAESIRVDLTSMGPGVNPSDGLPNGILGIARVDVQAYETDADRQLDKPTPHRADVLMLVTRREFEPFVYEHSDPTDAINYATFRHVVYAHANLGRLVDPDNDGNAEWSDASIRPVEPGDSSPSVINAANWHLARRITGFPATETEPLDTGEVMDWPFTHEAFTGQADSTSANVYTDVCEEPLSRLLADAWFGVDWNQAYFEYSGTNTLSSYYLRSLLPGSPVYRYDSESDVYYLFHNGYWYEHLGGTNWEAEDHTGTLNITENAPLQVADFSTNRRFWPDWFYVDGDSRPRIDPSPPVGQTERTAAYFLPGCSEFKVEFTYDDPARIKTFPTPGDPNEQSPLWFDWDEEPGDQGGALIPFPTAIEWQSVPDGQKWIWCGIGKQPGLYNPADPEDPPWQDNTLEFRWPKAVRITIRVHDPGGRLEEPVTHTIIHTW